MDTLIHTDLPIGVRGGSDTWDQPQASVLLANEWFSQPIATTIKCWNGSAWIIGTLKRWNGAAWVDTNLQRWNGSGWVRV